MSHMTPFTNPRTTDPTVPQSTAGLEIGQDIKVIMNATASPSGVTRTDTDTEDLKENASAFLGFVNVSGPRQGDQGVVTNAFTATYSGNADPNDITYNWAVSPATLFSPSGNTMTFTPLLETDYTITCTFVDSNSSDSGKQASMVFQTNIADDPGTDPTPDATNTFTAVNGPISTSLGVLYNYSVPNTDGDGTEHTELAAAGVDEIRIQVDLFFNNGVRRLITQFVSSGVLVDPPGDWKLQLVNLSSDPGVEPIFVNGSTLLNEDDWKLFGVGTTFAVGPNNTTGLDLMVHQIAP